MEKRNVYMKKLEENLTEYNTKLVEMKAKVAEVQNDLKAEYLSQVENLENKRDDFVVAARMTVKATTIARTTKHSLQYITPTV